MLAACGSTGGGFGNASGRPDAPAGVTAMASGTDVTVRWDLVPGARGYTVYWASASGVGPHNGTALASTGSPLVHRGLAAAQTHYYVVTAHNDAGESPPSPQVEAETGQATPGWTPAWALTTPARVLSHRHDPSASATDNGAALRAAIARLQPGDRLEVDAGRYSIAARFGITLDGGETAPIWIVGAPGAVLTRPDTQQNTVNVDRARFLVLQGFEITGGDTAVKLYDCADLWFDRCHVHDCNGVAVAANSQDTARLWLTRNEIHDTAGSGGEGMYLGANDGQFITHHSVVAENHVYRCGGSQGDGIELKQGSYANRIVANDVHDTNYPCILVYGTAGREPNVVERNVCYRSNDNVMQVQGEAIVRNNLLCGGVIGFESHDHQGQSRDLSVVHNTILTDGRGASLQAWNGRPGMVFANNVVYSSRGDALRFGSGDRGVTLSGNVVLGSTSGTGVTFLRGNGLADFAGASFDGSARDVRPSVVSPLRGAADPAFATPDDLVGAARQAPFAAGCRAP